ncbi:hypothetical protein SCYAM73S_08060 [Streptomyces cyaneofuscatus]
MTTTTVLTGPRKSPSKASASARRLTALAGLRERLAALGGSLEAGAAGDGLFRVTATVPLTAPRNRSDALHNRSGSASPDER